MVTVVQLFGPRSGLCCKVNGIDQTGQDNWCVVVEVREILALGRGGECGGGGGRIQFVVAMDHGGEADPEVGGSVGKPVAGKNIELPEIIARLVHGVAAVALQIPERVALRKKAAGKVVDHVGGQLLEGGVLTGKTRRGREGGDAMVQVRVGAAITDPDGPGVGHGVVERTVRGLLPVLRVGGRTGRRGWGRGWLVSLPGASWDSESET